MSLRIVTPLLFVSCFQQITIQSWKTAKLCGNTEAFNASVSDDSSYYFQSVHGCLTDKTIRNLNLLSAVSNFEENTFVNMSRLRSLSLSNMNVLNLKPGFVKNVPFLRKLYALNNRISVVRSGVFNELNLNELNLSSNIINWIDEGAFANFTTVLLNLKNNRISRIFSNWFRSSRIQKLDLSYNAITSLYRDSFEGLVGPRIINLNYNNIHFIEDETFGAPMYLKSLYVAGNFLTNAEFLNGIRADAVDVGFNMFSNVALETSTKIPKILIYPNPWNCKCLFKFWNYAWDRGISYGESPAKQKPPIVCIAQGDCLGHYIDTNLQKKYFRIVNYSNLGMYDSAY